ncbi:MAG: tail fiber domain-containing protein [Bacteroidales bacterium]
MKRIFKSFFLVIMVFSIKGYVIAQTDSEKSLKSDPSVPIFEIKNDAGQTVFAVYPGGVKIFINDNLKATGGGFTVGRLGTGKASDEDYFAVHQGDVRVNLGSPVKATGGGFTVGRLGTGKASNDTLNFFSVTPDSTTVNLSEGGTGEFKIGKLNKATGRDNFLRLSPVNYFIGHNVAPFLTTGKRNSVFGYFAGYKLNSGNSNIVMGDSAGFNLNGGTDNIIIGNKAGYNLTGSDISGGRWNIFLGNNAGLNSISPVRNIFIGYDAGRQNVSGQYNLYVGDQAGENGTGFYNTILGGLAATTNNFGNSNVIIGYTAGRDMVSGNNVMVGMGAGYNSTAAIGQNVFIGYYAGEVLPSQNYRLAISSNRSASAPLIYGEFDNERVVIKGTSANNPNNRTFFVNGQAGGTSDWFTDSDERLKSDISSIQDALEKVLSLRGVSYYWKDLENRGDKKQIGFIAQEVEKIIPEVVDNSNDHYSMQYAPVTALLVEAVKEQQKQIELLEKKNEALSNELNRVAQLETEISELKTLILKLTKPQKEEDE